MMSITSHVLVGIEPKPDLCSCAACGWEGSVDECEEEQESEDGFTVYVVDICPECGAGIESYSMSDARADEWNQWNNKKGN